MYVIASIIGTVIGLVVADRWHVDAMNDAFSEPSEEILETIRRKQPLLDANQAREIAEKAGVEIMGELSFRQRVRSGWLFYLIGAGLGIGVGCFAASCITEKK